MADNNNLNELVNQGVSIYGSREKIRYQLTNFAKKYLELQNVDFYKTSVVSYLIDCLSILSANHIFYDSVIYREFFLTEAQMSESVYNLAKWIGYQPSLATPARVDVMFTMPLSFQSSYATFSIPSNFRVWANDVPFLIDSIDSSVPAAYFSFDKNKFQSPSTVFGQVVNNNTISVKDSNGVYRPVYVAENGKTASFTLPFIQLEKVVLKFLIPPSIESFQFYSRTLNFKGMVSTEEVWVLEPKSSSQPISLDVIDTTEFDPTVPIDNNPWVKWSRSEHGIYTMSPNSLEYVLTGGTDKVELFFGNGIVGKQPPPGSAVVIVLYVTKGSDGFIIPNSINKHDPLYYTTGARFDEQGVPISDKTSKLLTIDFSVMNPTQSLGGSDIPSLPEIKRNAIVNLRSKGKLVSDLDYDDINTIMGENFPAVEAFPILKRSDIKVNEIMPFIRFDYHDELFHPQIVPMKNIKLMVYNPTFIDNEYTLFRGTQTEVDSIWKKTILGDRVGYEVPSLIEPDIRKFDTLGNETTPLGNTALELGFAEYSGDLYETLFNITIHSDTMMAYYDYACKHIYGAPATLYPNTSFDPYINQFSYIPITGIQFDINFSSTSDNTNSSSSTGENSSIGALTITTNLNHIPCQEITQFRCLMTTKWENNQQYTGRTTYVSNMQPDATPIELSNPEDADQYTKYKQFIFEIPNYLEVPTGIQRFEFQIQAYTEVRDTNHNLIIDQSTGNYLFDWQTVSTYYADIVIRQDLSDVMFSSVTKTNEWGGETHNYYRYEIHNVPVILSRYLSDPSGGTSGILQRSDNSTDMNFEMTVLQKLINSISMSSRRMLTDSINIKACDTYGKLNNLKYNPVDYIVRSRFNTPFETQANPQIIFDSGFNPIDESQWKNTISRFIVNAKITEGEYPTIPLSQYINNIAEWYPDPHNPGTGIWRVIPPTRGMYVKVLDELDLAGDTKIIAYTGSEWKDVQEFDIPLKIKARIQIEKNATTSNAQLISNVKTALMEYFLPRFGIQKNLDRSEVTKIIRTVPGVVYCDLVEPEIDIKFDYELKDLSQQSLLDYTPQYVGFNEDTINIEVQS